MQFTVYDANEESKRIKLGEAFDTENNFSIRSLFVIFYSNYIHAMWKHFQWTASHLSIRIIWNCELCCKFMSHISMILSSFFPLDFVILWSVDCKGREVSSTFHFAFMRAYVISFFHSIGNWKFNMIFNALLIGKHLHVESHWRFI